MVSLYYHYFGHDPGAEFICMTKSEKGTDPSETNRCLWEQQHKQCSGQVQCWGRLVKILLPFLHTLAQPFESQQQIEQHSFFFCKWLHTPSPAGKNMGCWGNTSKSYPSPEHFPGPDPKDRRLPQGHHHPPWATRTSETPNITCLGSTDLPLGLLGVGFWTCALMA